MPLCDTLLRAAEAEFYRPYFSQEILDEVTRNLVKKGKMTDAKAAQYQKQIKRAFPEAMIEVPDELVQQMTNHPKDRHVLAVAVKAKAGTIVTFNLRDFSQESLEIYDIEAKHPDEFLLELCHDFTVSALTQVIKKQAADLKNPPNTLKDVLGRLSRQVPMFVSKILCHEYGHNVAQIAKKTLQKAGYTQANGERVYEGKQYCLRQKNAILTIIDKNSQSEILKLECGQIEGFLSLEDVNKFEEVNRNLE